MSRAPERGADEHAAVVVASHAMVVLHRRVAQHVGGEPGPVGSDLDQPVVRVGGVVVEALAVCGRGLSPGKINLAVNLR